MTWFTSLFQTPTGAWHITSILTATAWLLTGAFMFWNLKINRDDRTRAYTQSQAAKQEVNTLKETTTTVIKLAGLEGHFETPETLRAKPNMEAFGPNFLIDAGNIFGASRTGNQPIGIQGLQVRLVNVGSDFNGLMGGEWLAGQPATRIPLKVSVFDGPSFEDRTVEVKRLQSVYLIGFLTDEPSNKTISLDECEAKLVPTQLKLRINGLEHSFVWDATRYQVSRTLIEQQLR